ncbi:hypothetical protein BUE76_11105 [Cnuella takakiae]|nr:hypothetical protein BUE76_11105 [Cnuella takakiae]
MFFVWSLEFGVWSLEQTFQSTKDIQGLLGTVMPNLFRHLLLNESVFIQKGVPKQFRWDHISPVTNPFSNRSSLQKTKN